jgi:hypothetical protein
MVCAPVAQAMANEPKAAPSIRHSFRRGRLFGALDIVFGATGAASFRAQAFPRLAPLPQNEAPSHRNFTKAPEDQ